MIELNNIIEKCKDIILTPETTQYIQALYIGGSIKPEDRTPKSDLDLIGIVDDAFEEDLEAVINGILKNKIQEMKCKLRVLYLSELKGGKQKGFITTLLPIRLFIRRIPYFPLIWGTQLDINETIGAYSFEEELTVQSNLIKKYIANTNGKEIPFEWIPKAVLYLSAIELVLEKKVEYSTSFTKNQECWMDDSQHIAHDSMKIREKEYKISELEKKSYITKVEAYLSALSLRSNEWL